MSPENPVTAEESQTSGARKTAPLRPPEQALKCPRCDSPNTKFCYYNNYSLTQPRHFCKTCRRYWTKGGALRNVPIGGGCRKNKKIKSTTRFSGDPKDPSGSSEMGGLKFLQSLSPAMDFQLGGSTVYNNQFSSFIDPSSSSSSLMGFNFNYPLPKPQQEMGPLTVNSSLASSIESLSCMNQDLHWKLQQQRLAMLFGGDEDRNKNGAVSHVVEMNQTQKPQPILFHNLEVSKPEIAAVGNHSRKGTEWFFENCYDPASAAPNSNGGDNGNNWAGVQTWSTGDLHQYSALP